MNKSLVLAMEHLSSWGTMKGGAPLLGLREKGEVLFYQETLVFFFWALSDAYKKAVEMDISLHSGTVGTPVGDVNLPGNWRDSKRGLWKWSVSLGGEPGGWAPLLGTLKDI